MRTFLSIGRVSFMKPQQGGLQLKDPLKDLKISVEAMQRKQKLIFKTTTGSVPKSVQDKWLQNPSFTTEIIEREKNIDLPYNFEGIDQVPETKYSYMFKSMLGAHKIYLDKLDDHLIKIYRGVLYSLAAQDEEFLYEYTEKRFADRALESLRNLQEKGDQVITEEDFGANQGEPIPYKCFQVQGALIKGLSVDREKNLAENEYHIWRDIDPFGLDVYTPIAVTEPDNFINKKESDHLYDDFKKVVLRLMVRIQSPLRLKIIKSNGMNQEIFVNNDEYSYNHMAIFESQLLEPKQNSGWQHMGMMLWLQNFRMSTWKLADIDNWMEGNPLILKGNSRELYRDDVFKDSIYDTRCLVDVRNV